MVSLASTHMPSIDSIRILNMTQEEQTALLTLLDQERQTIIYPGVTRISEEGILKDISTDGKSCQIVYTHASESDIDRIITDQIEAVRTLGYELEWKIYGHDEPHSLGERLQAAGFQPDDVEQFMVFHANSESVKRFGPVTHDIRKITTREGLADFQKILEEINGKSCAGEMEQYAFMLEHHPDNLSFYIAYVNNEPATCARIYFHKDSKFAGLYGGNTLKRFRNRGLYTQIAAARIQEAISRGVPYVTIDAAPTSEPILKKRGFEIVTYTQPYGLCNKSPQSVS